MVTNSVFSIDNGAKPFTFTKSATMITAWPTPTAASTEILLAHQLMPFRGYFCCKVVVHQVQA